MRSIQYGSQEIFFELQRSVRKTLAIEVHPDSSVHVIAPEKSLINEIDEKVEKRARWIIKQQEYFEQFLPRTPEREYVTGETHYYLGRSYLLKVSLGDENQVKLKAGRLEVTCKSEVKPETVKKLLAKWYFQHAEKKFSSIMLESYLRFKEYDFDIPQVVIKRMTKRWGSCNTVDKIVVNPEIIKAPSKCIEYLMVHEMCHFIERNHTKRFYAILTDVMPDWERWKNKLEQLLS